MGIKGEETSKIQTRGWERNYYMGITIGKNNFYHFSTLFSRLSQNDVSNFGIFNCSLQQLALSTDKSTATNSLAIGHFRVPCASVSNPVFAQNLSYENAFDLYEKTKTCRWNTFSYE